MEDLTRDTTKTQSGEIVDLREDSEVAPSELSLLRQRMMDVEQELAAARLDVGRLQLQLDLFTSTDPTTGLVNRAGTFDAIDTATERLDRMGEPFAVMLIEISELDELRRMDEEDTGEIVRHIGALIGGGLRRLDQVGRLNHGCFVTVLSNVDADHIQIVLTRVRSALTATAIDLGDSLRKLNPKMATIVAMSPKEVNPETLLDQVQELLMRSEIDTTLVI